MILHVDQLHDFYFEYFTDACHLREKIVAEKKYQWQNLERLSLETSMFCLYFPGR
jgi:hypothetical protein